VKRLLIAAVMAVAIHALLLGAEPRWLAKRITHKSTPRVVTLTLAYYRPQRPEIEPGAKRPEISPKKAVATRKNERQRQFTQAKSKFVPKPEETKVAEEPSYAALDFQEDILEGQEINERDKTDSQPPGSVIHEARPIYRKNPPPRYPGLARRKGYQGTVVLEVLVDERGKVGGLRVITSSGYAILDRAAVGAVENWLFEPGVREGEAVAMRVKIPVRFELD
jgi:protein TonB